MRSITPILVALITPLSGAWGQQASFLGIVTDSASGTPVEGATVSLVEAAQASITDQRGSFLVEGIGSGVHTILVRAVGYEPWGMRLQLNVTQDMEVEIGNINLIPQRAVRLDAIEVEGEEFRRSPGFSGFQHRMRTEKGTFLTSDDIERIAPQRTSDIFKRVSGFRTLASGTIASSRGVPSIQNGFSLCAVQYFVDGVHSGMDTVEDIIPSSIAGIEVYSGSSTIPPYFRGTGNLKCGVVAIWTADGVRRQ